MCKSVQPRSHTHAISKERIYRRREFDYCRPSYLMQKIEDVEGTDNNIISDCPSSCTLVYRAILFCSVQYSTAQYCTLLYSTVLYSTVLYSTLSFSARIKMMSYL